MLTYQKVLNIGEEWRKVAVDILPCLAQLPSRSSFFHVRSDSFCQIYKSLPCGKIWKGTVCEDRNINCPLDIQGPRRINTTPFSSSLTGWRHGIWCTPSPNHPIFISQSALRLHNTISLTILQYPLRKNLQALFSRNLSFPRFISRRTLVLLSRGLNFRSFLGVSLPERRLSFDSVLTLHDFWDFDAFEVSCKCWKKIHDPSYYILKFSNFYWKNIN